MEAIPPVFQDPIQRMLYDFYPAPPIELPVTEGETDEFPRNYWPIFRETLKHRLRQRRSLYRQMVRQIASNARRPKRGKHIFIIKPETMDRLLEAVESIHSPASVDVRHALWSMYFQGKILKELDVMVSRRTISRLLLRAERIASVIPEDAPAGLVIGIPTIKLSYQILRYARDGLFDVQPYFRGRIF